MDDRNGNLKLAVLIDAENVPYSRVKEMFDEIAKYGIPTFKRIYADWTKPVVTGWKKILLENAITPIQQYSYSTGKNSSDSAMIIDAMDILYSGRVDGFCIVSSDSDFTRLVTRLREAGMWVIGMGERKTANPFIAACDKFIYIEILKAEDSQLPLKGKKSKEEPSITQNTSEITRLLDDSIDDLADEDGWAFLGDLGNLMLKKKPDFDPRNYGFTKMLQLVKAINKHEINIINPGNGNIRHVYVRKKDEK